MLNLPIVKLKQKFSHFIGGVYLAQQGILNDFFKSEGDFAAAGKGIKNLFNFGANSPAGSTSAGTLITSVLQILLLVAGSLAVVYLVIGGIKYVVSRGNEEKVESAKGTMSAAIIGLVVIIMSFAVITIISKALIQGGYIGTGVPEP